MTETHSITAEELRRLLHYDAETGVFTWLPRPDTGRASRIWNTRYAGKQAGATMPVGYRYITLRPRGCFYAHRLAWLYIHGEWPADQIDHRDLCRDHNWIDNLRPATNGQNMANTRVRKNSTTGLKGVSLHRKSGLWRARITRHRQEICLGYFRTPEEAAEAYRSAAPTVHGDFHRT